MISAMGWRIRHPRRRARSEALTALALIGVLAGCSTAPSATPHPTVDSTSSTSAGTVQVPVTSISPSPTPSPSVTSAPTRLPTTTTTAVPLPPLTAPTPIAALVSPSLPGEGTWVPAGDKLARGYATYTTALRAAAGLPLVGVAWMDSAATRVALYAGTGEPLGTWPAQGSVAAAQQPKLVAAFNSGFKIYASRTGWYDQGRTAVALQAGAASLVIFTNGSAAVADWGRDINLGANVAAVRQNLVLLVDHGVATPSVAQPSEWGAVLGGGVTTWRSGIGVTAAGDLVYAGGPDLSPASLANVLVAAGATRAMELDINPAWVSFAIFRHTGGIGGPGVTGANLLPGMSSQPGHYLQPYSRDFFAVFAG